MKRAGERYAKKMAKGSTGQPQVSPPDWQKLYSKYGSKQNWESMARQYERRRVEEPDRLDGSPRYKINQKFEFMPDGPRPL